MSTGVALVTGASRGIGRAIAIALREDGFRLALVGRSEQGLEETNSAVGGTGVVVVCDVTDPTAVSEASAQVMEALGPVDVLVNNAASFGAIGPIWDVDPDDWWTDAYTSIRGAFLWSRGVLPEMIRAEQGRIVNITSYAGFRPAPFETGYAAGKAGLTSLTEGLAAEVASLGIRVFAVAPGFTDTQITRNILRSDEGKRWLPASSTREPLPAEATARLVARLARGDCDELTGRVLHTLDNLDDLLARLPEIQAGDLYVPRLRRL